MCDVGTTEWLWMGLLLNIHCFPVEYTWRIDEYGCFIYKYALQFHEYDSWISQRLSSLLQAQCKRKSFLRTATIFVKVQRIFVSEATIFINASSVFNTKAMYIWQQSQSKSFDGSRMTQWLTVPQSVAFSSLPTRLTNDWNWGIKSSSSVNGTA